MPNTSTDWAAAVVEPATAMSLAMKPGNPPGPAPLTVCWVLMSVAWKSTVMLRPSAAVRMMPAPLAVPFAAVTPVCPDTALMTATARSTFCDRLFDLRPVSVIATWLSVSTPSGSKKLKYELFWAPL